MDEIRRDNEARTAAYSLIKGNNRLSRENASLGLFNLPNDQPNYDETEPMITGYSINTTPVDEEMIEGVEQDGKISAVRRFFCLFVVFDLSFTALLWLACLVIGTKEFKTEIINQITLYSIKRSLFDIVLTSLCRSVVLLLMYGLVRISHWWTVALTTTVSSAFLIGKIFYFEWQDVKYNNNYYVFAVILILCSFIISWGETWFLDFRVLPQEQRARDILARYDERRSRPGVRPIRPATNYRYGSIDGTETQTFYSPIPSQDVSEDEDETLSNEAQLQHSIKCDEYKRTAAEIVQAAATIFKSDDWKLQKTTPKGDEVYIKQISQPKGKVFRLKTIIPIRPRSLLNELFDKVEAVPKWNPSINFSKIIYSVDNCTDITYQVVNDLASGVVSSRDFVNLRRWELRDDMYIIGVAATEHSSMPPVKNCIRGENGTSGCFLSPYGENKEDCLLEMLVQVDLKGWLPQSLVDQTMTTVLIDYANHLKNYVSTLSQTQSM